LEAEALSGDRGRARHGEGTARLRGVAHAVVTAGARGCVYAGAAGKLEVPAPVVDVVDTVACGDALNGALAVSLRAGTDVDETLRVAVAAGAAAATRAGAYASLPTAGAVRLLSG
jgi:ribokinase